MSHGHTLYRFQLELSDIERSVYESLDFRLSLHPSESLSFLLTRMIAYALNFEEGLNFSAKGLGDPDEPCLSKEDPRGGKSLWIEIGNPSARRLHKAAKSSKKVKVYTYKNPELLLEELAREKIHHADSIEVTSLTSSFLEMLESKIQKDNRWGLVRDQGSLSIQIEEDSFSGDLKQHTLEKRP